MTPGRVRYQSDRASRSLQLSSVLGICRPPDHSTSPHHFNSQYLRANASRFVCQPSLSQTRNSVPVLVCFDPVDAEVDPSGTGGRFMKLGRPFSDDASHYISVTASKKPRKNKNCLLYKHSVHAIVINLLELKFSIRSDIEFPLKIS